MSELLTVVLASQNEGKLLELRALFADLPLELLSVNEALAEPATVIESGATFEENALIKARAACQASRLIALADDSGLEVDALHGRPGVRSARFAHERATDAENNALLLRELEAVEEPQRTARFRCVLALVTPWNDAPRIVSAQCDGAIARTLRGSGGFGYDPLFLVAGEHGRAMAELSEAEKNRVSHRGRAARALRPLLVALLNARLDEAERAAG